MSTLPHDPEEYMTIEFIGIGTRDGLVEERIGETSGKHQYEVCLFETYQQTKKFFSNSTEVEKHKQLEHLYRIKSDILRYAVPRELAWKHYVNTTSGNLIIKPLLDSDLYFRMMAFNLFLLPAREVKRFMDFQFVHAVLKPYPSKSKDKRIESKIQFLRQVNLWVMHLLDNQLAVHREEVSNEVFSWVDAQISQFSEKELIQFHEYEFSSIRKYGISEDLMSPLKPQYAGCDDEILRAYFKMLSDASTIDKKPLVSETAIDYLLYSWFGVGKHIEFPMNEKVYVTIEEMAFFFKGFLDKFQIHTDQTRRAVTQKQIVDLLYQNLSEIFRDNSKDTVYRKFSAFSNKGQNPDLDWKKNDDLKALIGHQ
ncbi:hypothetical protein OAE48_04165 [Flavobacteriales bacterium]|nr:hypothetical protein [Flavobacteriales bacterium]